MPASLTPETPLVVVVDDEESVLDSLTIFIRRHLGFRIRAFQHVDAAREALDRTRPDVLLTDIAMDGREAGVDLLQYTKRRWPDVPVILMSAVASREALIQAINAGAFCFLEKPFRNEVLAQRLREAVAAAATRDAARVVAETRGKHARSRRHNHPGARAAAAAARAAASPRALIGESPAFLETVALVEQAAATDVTVLLEGESGVGKGVLAGHLHACSPRSTRPFLSVNCGAIPETLIESQFFGHMKGAFTGADQDQRGFLRAAEGGTLFLDEVSELSPAMQVKLLRVLQEREAIPVGGTAPYRVDVRFVAASNRNLKREVAEGRLREDLYWRLNVMAIRVPPLRERPDDIPLLAQHTLERLIARDRVIRARRFADETLAALQRHDWPGNVRELENAVERAAIVAGEVIHPSDLPTGLGVVPTSAKVTNPVPNPGAAFAGTAGGPPTLAVVEHAYVRWVLSQVGDDVTRAAQVLGLPPVAVRAILATAPTVNVPASSA